MMIKRFSVIKKVHRYAVSEKDGTMHFYSDLSSLFIYVSDIMHISIADHNP